MLPLLTQGDLHHHTGFLLVGVSSRRTHWSTLVESNNWTTVQPLFSNRMVIPFRKDPPLAWREKREPKSFNKNRFDDVSWLVKMLDLFSKVYYHLIIANRLQMGFAFPHSSGIPWHMWGPPLAIGKQRRSDVTGVRSEAVTWRLSWPFLHVWKHAFNLCHGGKVLGHLGWRPDGQVDGRVDGPVRSAVRSASAEFLGRKYPGCPLSLLEKLSCFTPKLLMQCEKHLGDTTYFWHIKPIPMHMGHCTWVIIHGSLPNFHTDETSSTSDEIDATRTFGLLPVLVNGLAEHTGCNLECDMGYKMVVYAGCFFGCVYGS